MRAHRSIFSQLVGLGLVLILPLTAFVGWGLYQQFQKDRDDALRDLTRLRQISEKQIQGYLDGAHGRLDRLSQRVAATQASRGEVEPLLREFAALNPEYSNVALIDTNGIVQAAVTLRPANPTQSMATYEPYKLAMEAKGFLVARPFKGPITGRWVGLLSNPVLDANGQRTGTLLLPLNLIELSHILTYDPAESNTLLGVIDDSGTIVLRSFKAEEYIGQTAPQIRNILQDADRPGGGKGQVTGFDGTRRTYSAGRLPNTPWIVTVSVPTSEVFGAAQENLWHALGLVAAVTVLVVLMTFFYARRLARPLTDLANAARAQSAGRFDATAPVAGPVEVAETAHAFNEMVGSLRRADESLLESEGRYRELFQNNPLPMWVYQLETFAFLDVNAAAIEHYGYTREEFLRMTIKDVRPQQDIPRLVDYVRELAMRTSQGGAVGTPGVWPHRKKNGEIILVDVAAHPLNYRGASSMMALLNDVTSSRRAAIALEESERRYRTVIDQTGQMIYDYDVKSGRVSWFGRIALEKILGGTPEEFSETGVTGWRDRLHPDDQAAAIARFDHSLVTGDPCQAEYRLRHKDGTYRVVEERGIVIRDAQGTVSRMVGRMSDITDRKREEEARQQMEKKLLETQKLESLGVLAGGIAHDFNNLLTGILGNAGLARLESPAGWEGVTYLSQIEKAALRAADLCKQMLAYSGKGRFVVQKIDLNEVLEETTQLLSISISKKAALRLALERPLPAIQADATQLRQIVMNLVINASEAIGDNTGNITLRTGRLHADQAYLANAQFAGEIPAGDYVFLEVSDDGSGMSAETVARIFDPFFTTKFTGRGLGLAAVLGIVRGHKGAIKVYSEPGRGTSFKILLPATEGAAQPLGARTPGVAGWRGSGRVLVIDDEETVRQVSANVLRALGFEVDLAIDGVEAVKMFTGKPGAYTLVLLDLTMPNMDGEETYRQLRQISPAIRVILMSGFNKVDAINRFTGKGLAGFVQKPFELETLATELRRVLEPRNS